MPLADRMLVHASSVSLDDQGVLIAGPSGSGKSDLALRLIDQGARLIADDQCELRVENERLFVTAPASIEGLIEVRYVGLLTMPFVPAAPVALYIELVTEETGLPRLPESNTIFLLDRPVRHFRLPAFAASTPAKIRAALRYPLATGT